MFAIQTIPNPAMTYPRQSGHSKCNATATPGSEWYRPCSRDRVEGSTMDERNPRRNDESMDDQMNENIDDRTNDEEIVDTSEDAEEFEDIEEKDEEDVEASEE